MPRSSLCVSGKRLAKRRDGSDTDRNGPTKWLKRNFGSIRPFQSMRKRTMRKVTQCSLLSNSCTLCDGSNCSNLLLHVLKLLPPRSRSEPLFAPSIDLKRLFYMPPPPLCFFRLYNCCLLPSFILMTIITDDEGHLRCRAKEIPSARKQRRRRRRVLSAVANNKCRPFQRSGAPAQGGEEPPAVRSTQPAQAA